MNKKISFFIIAIATQIFLLAQENSFPPETTWAAEIPISLQKPIYLQTIHEPKHEIDYTCISNATVFGVSSGSNALRHHYAKDQAWNVDMSKIILGENYLINANDYSFDKKLIGSYSDSRWSNVDSKIRYFCSSNKLLKVNIETEEITLLHSFPGYNTTIGPWEGNISADDKYVVVVHEENDVGKKASLYDIELDSVLSQKDFPGAGVDWVSIVPSGNYIVASNNQTQKVEVYDLEFNFIRNIGIGTEHGDFAIDSEGNEVFVQVIPLSMSRLKDGKFTRLLQPNIGGHISGRGFANPGWALVSTDINQDDDGSYNYVTEMFSIKLDGSGTIRHYGHSRSSCTTYENYPLASVSPDGKKIIFNSDWDLFGNGGNALAYIAEYKINTAINKPGDNIKRKQNIKLLQNYPNPFNPTTIINYTLPTDGIIKLSVFNVLGQQIKILINGFMQAGSYSTPFDGSNLSSGIYFYKLESNNQIQSKKMLLL